MSSVSPRRSGERVAAGLDAGVVRVEPAAGRQPDREVVVEPVDRRVVVDRLERRPRPGHRVLPQPRVEEQLARDGSRRSTATGARPAPRAARSSSRRGPARAGGPRPRCASACVAPVVPHPAGQLEDDGEVVAGLAGRLERLADALDPALGVGDRALASRPRPPAAGRTTSASSAVLVRKMSWTTRKSRSSRRWIACCLVGLRLDRVLADHVERWSARRAPSRRTSRTGASRASAGR